MPPKQPDHEFWEGQVDARLSIVEKQVEAVWVKMGSISADVTDIKTDVRELRTLLDSLPARVGSLEESRARGRGAVALATIAAGLVGAFVSRLFP